MSRATIDFVAITLGAKDLAQMRARVAAQHPRSEPALDLSSDDMEALLALAEQGLKTPALMQALRDIDQQLQEDRAWTDNGFRYMPGEIPHIIAGARPLFSPEPAPIGAPSPAVVAAHIVDIVQEAQASSIGRTLIPLSFPVDEPTPTL